MFYHYSVKEKAMASNRMGRINEEIQRELAALIPTVKEIGRAHV